MNFPYFPNTILRQLGLREPRSHGCFLGKDRNPKRGINRVINGPSPGDSIPKDKVANLALFSQIHHGHFFSIILKRSIASPIVGLFFCGSPSAVFGLIISVVLYSIERMFPRGLIPHVSHEALKSSHPILANFPSFAHRYAPRPIALVFLCLFIPASREHCCPLRIRWMISSGWPVVARECKGVVLHGLFITHESDNAIKTEPRRAWSQ